MQRTSRPPLLVGARGFMLGVPTVTAKMRGPSGSARRTADCWDGQVSTTAWRGTVPCNLPTTSEHLAARTTISQSVDCPTYLGDPERAPGRRPDEVISSSGA